MTKRYSHEDLRSWGASLDREQPQGLGETLLCYADDWRNEVERLREALRNISLASQNSMSSKEECGFIARAALDTEDLEE